MNIKINSCLKGAQSAIGTTIIIDVFRASNTIIACLSGQAEYIIPIGSLDEAYLLKKTNPSFLLFGERGGLPPEGFDYGNSPFEASQLDLEGQKIILTTSAGSQGIVNSTGASEILIASFANLEAVASHIETEAPANVSIVPIGLDALVPAEEDEACAELLKARLEGQLETGQGWKDRLLDCDGAKRLRRLGQHRDLEFCMQLNTHLVVPRFDPTTKRLNLL